MSESQKIIVIDDDISMAQAIERLLMTAGRETRTFFSAEDFLKSDWVLSARFLIFDIQLPGMSGLDLHRHLVAEGMKVKVIFITGHDLPFLRNSAERSGAAAYFTKPFPGDDLINAVNLHFTNS